jgi:hypothetical protein
MAPIVDENWPHALRGDPDETDRRSATSRFARAGRQGVEHDDLAGGEAALLIHGLGERCRARWGGGEA